MRVPLVLLLAACRAPSGADAPPDDTDPVPTSWTGPWEVALTVDDGVFLGDTVYGQVSLLRWSDAGRREPAWETLESVGPCERRAPTPDERRARGAGADVVRVVHGGATLAPEPEWACHDAAGADDTGREGCSPPAWTFVLGEDLPLAWGAPIGVQVEDDVFPAVDLAEAVVLPPAQVRMTSPSPGTFTLRDALTVSWEPGPPGGEALVIVDGSTRDGSLTWWCTVPDDGSFDVPADVLASVPSPAGGSVVVQRAVTRTTEVSPGVLVTGSARSQDGRSFRR